MLACLAASQLLSASSSPGGNSARSADQTASAKSATDTRSRSSQPGSVTEPEYFALMSTNMEYPLGG